MQNFSFLHSLLVSLRELGLRETDLLDVLLILRFYPELREEADRFNPQKSEIIDLVEMLNHWAYNLLQILEQKEQ